MQFTLVGQQCRAQPGSGLNPHPATVLPPLRSWAISHSESRHDRCRCQRPLCHACPSYSACNTHPRTGTNRRDEALRESPDVIPLRTTCLIVGCSRATGSEPCRWQTDCCGASELHQITSAHFHFHGLCCEPFDRNAEPLRHFVAILEHPDSDRRTLSQQDKQAGIMNDRRIRSQNG